MLTSGIRSPFPWDPLKLLLNGYFVVYFINLRNNFYVLLKLHSNITIAFFANLMHKFFILVHLLHSSTCFEHCCSHLLEDSCINTASGIVNLGKSEWS